MYKYGVQSIYDKPFITFHVRKGITDQNIYEESAITK